MFEPTDDMARTSGGGPALARADFDKSLVWGFDLPHPVGALCGPDCKICGIRIMKGAKGEPLSECPPLLILGLATWEDHAASNRRRGGLGRSGPSTYKYYYFVSTD